MAERITIGDTVFEVSAQAAPVFAHRNEREWRYTRITATAAAARAAFVTGATYSREWDSLVSTTDPDTGETTETTEVCTEPMSDYCIAGDIIDHRDGTVTVLMGKKTTTELQQETIDALLLELLGV